MTQTSMFAACTRLAGAISNKMRREQNNVPLLRWTGEFPFIRFARWWGTLWVLPCWLLCFWAVLIWRLFLGMGHLQFIARPDCWIAAGFVFSILLLAVFCFAHYAAVKCRDCVIFKKFKTFMKMWQLNVFFNAAVLLFFVGLFIEENNVTSLQFCVEKFVWVSIYD